MPKTSFETVHEATARFTEKLADNDILLVIDDIWDSQHAKPFVQGGEKCARLMTTRFMNIALDNNANTNDVDEMSPEQSVDMLLAGIDEKPDDTTDFITLAQRLGEWALMLEIVNGILREALTLGDDIRGALDYVNEVLDEEGISGIEKDSGDERNQSATGVLSASFRQLKEKEKNALFELAIFLDDSDIPLTSLMALWKMGFARVRKQITRFARYSFVKYDAEKQTIRIHDVVREVLAGKLSQITELATVHARLIDNYGDLNALPDDYAWRNIAYHLDSAGMLPELKALLLNIDFLQAKLEQTNPNALIDDYDTFKDDRGMNLVQSGLKFISHKLTKDPKLMPVELQQCLVGYYKKYDAIQVLLNIQNDVPQIFPIHQTFPIAGGNLIRRLVGHTGSVTDVVISGEYAISASKDGSLIVWNWQMGEQVSRLEGHTGSVTDVVIEGEYAISVSNDKSLIVWKWQMGEQVSRLGHSAYVNSVALEGDFAISASRDGSLIVWNWQSGKQVRRLEGHTGYVTSVVISGEYAISESEDKSLIVWNWQTGEELHRLDGYLRIMAIVGNYAFLSNFGTLIVWNWQSGEQVQKLEGHSGIVRSVAILGDTAISASQDNSLIVWNWQSGKEAIQLQGHAKRVLNVTISGDTVISTSSDGSLIMWNWRTGEEVHRLEGHSHNVASVAISGEYAISASFDRSLIVWNWQTGKELCRFQGHSDAIKSVAISGDIAISASGSLSTGDNGLIVWNWQTGKQVRKLEGHSDFVYAVAILDETAISASFDRSLIVWNWQTGEELRRLKGHYHPVTKVAISGEYTISASRDSMLIVWNWQTGEELRRLKGHSDLVISVAISGDTAISASNDQSMIVWNWKTGERLSTFYTDSPQSTVVIGDGMIISGGADGQVHFFKPNLALRKLLGW